MNAKAYAAVFPDAGFVPARPDEPSRLVRRANKAYLKALREAEASLWSRQHPASNAILRSIPPRLTAPANDPAETWIMLFLLGFSVVAIGGLLYAGFASGDFVGGVRAVVEGVLR